MRPPLFKALMAAYDLSQKAQEGHDRSRVAELLKDLLAWMPHPAPALQWKKERPEAPGFYYWQNSELQAISPNAVRVVQVCRYLRREGFSAETLAQHDAAGTTFDCDLDKTPAGWWAGPLPQPF